jgi:K+-sensing histidine kinase KdpD
MTTIYRNYMIARLGDKFVARSTDDECLLVSTSQQRLNSAIDDLWDSLERGREPAWFTGSSAIDLDTFGPEAAPSSSDPPPNPTEGGWKISYTTFSLSAVAFSLPLSYLIQTTWWPNRVDCMMTVGVCAVAVAFGRRFALLAALIATLEFNLVAVPPILEFSIPTFSEFGLVVMNLVAAIGIPELLKLRCLQAVPGRGRTRRT